MVRWGGVGQGDWGRRVVKCEAYLDASAFAEATADKQCWMLDARKMVSS